MLAKNLQMNEPLTVPDLLDNASKLSSNDFETFIKEVLTLRAKRLAPVLTERETSLLEKIYRKLPEAILKRHEWLSEKRRQENISKEEYEELLALTQMLEKDNVERMEYIVELASSRKVTPQALMKQLDLMPLHNG